MADIINLRQARKDKARRTAETEATANRALHGRTKAEKTLDAAEKERRDHLLDQAKIEREKPDRDQNVEE